MFTCLCVHVFVTVIVDLGGRCRRNRQQVIGNQKAGAGILDSAALLLVASAAPAGALAVLAADEARAARGRWQEEEETESRQGKLLAALYGGGAAEEDSPSPASSFRPVKKLATAPAARVSLYTMLTGSGPA